MAGSLNHIIGDDGRFTMSTIENLGDAHEALVECFKIILQLSGGDMGRIRDACRIHHCPDPFRDSKRVMQFGGGDSL
jgi:hypothetical protein